MNVFFGGENSLFIIINSGPCFLKSDSPPSPHPRSHELCCGPGACLQEGAQAVRLGRGPTKSAFA